MCRNFIASFLWLLYKIISSIIFIGFSLLEFAYNKFSKTTVFEKIKKQRKENDGWKKKRPQGGEDMMHLRTEKKAMCLEYVIRREQW